MNKQEERGESLKMLKDWVKPGTQIYTILRHVSRSGMSRQISFVMFENNKPILLDYHISRLLGYKVGKHDGLIIGGCGMDMGFHVTYTLARVLWPNGHTCLGDWDKKNKCPSNDHTNGKEYAHDVLEAMNIVHHDGGYTLPENRWL